MDWSGKFCTDLTIVLCGQRLLQPEQHLYYRADNKNKTTFNSSTPKLINSVVKRVLFYNIRLHLKEAETWEYKELTQSCRVCVEENTAEYCTIPTFLLPLKSNHRKSHHSKSPQAAGIAPNEIWSSPRVPPAHRPRSSLSAQVLALGPWLSSAVGKPVSLGFLTCWSWHDVLACPWTCLSKGFVAGLLVDPGHFFCLLWDGMLRARSLSLPILLPPMIPAVPWQKQALEDVNRRQVWLSSWKKQQWKKPVSLVVLTKSGFSIVLDSSSGYKWISRSFWKQRQISRPHLHMYISQVSPHCSHFQLYFIKI